jgi:hypothetical protein
MNKRRRTSSVASRGQDEESGETDAVPEPTRKKKKLDPVSKILLQRSHPKYFICQEDALKCKILGRCRKDNYFVRKENTLPSSHWTCLLLQLTQGTDNLCCYYHKVFIDFIIEFSLSVDRYSDVLLLSNGKQK